MSQLQKPLVATGQQIGVGWTPALSVVKALAALAEAGRIGGEAVYWMADEDHDRLEVASTVALEAGRLIRRRVPFGAPEGTATGWLPWGEAQQRAASGMWGDVPAASGTLRDHAQALGTPLWARGLRPFSPTDPAVREPIQTDLERWRSLGLEAHLGKQAELIEAAGLPLPLDPRRQAAWFSLDPRSGLRKRLEPGQACPSGHWLSPGAAVRPLMQTLLLNPTAVVLGPAERAYWRLTEPLWERVGLHPPRIVARPTAFVVPGNSSLRAGELESLRQGDWASLVEEDELPSSRISADPLPEAWGAPVAHRFEQELARTRLRLRRLDRRVLRDLLGERWGMDPERLRQRLFPLGLAQERVLPGLFWLRDEGLLDRMLEALRRGGDIVFVEES